MIVGERPEAMNDLIKALGEAVNLAEEGWEYASPYFREKWECEKDFDNLRATLNAAVTDHARRNSQ